MAKGRVRRRRIPYAASLIEVSTVAALLLFAIIPHAPAFPVH